MRYTAEHKARTRQTVLDEAARAIRAHGPHRLGVAEVMSRAGLTHGGFYAHFGSRDALVAAAIDQMFDHGRARLQAIIMDRAPADALAAYIDMYLSPRHRDSRTAGCPLPYLSADAPRLEGEVRQRFAAGVAGLTRALAAQIAALGQPPQGLDPQVAAASMLSELVGALSLARAEPDPGRSDAILDHTRTSLRRRLGLESLA